MGTNCDAHAAEDDVPRRNRDEEEIHELRRSLVKRAQETVAAAARCSDASEDLTRTARRTRESRTALRAIRVAEREKAT